MGPEASPGRSEGQIVRSGVELGRMTALFAVLVTQLRTVVGPDQVAEVFKELDDGEGLLRRPICGNGEGDCQEQSGRGWAHELVSVVYA
jgi:hypothetical protein